MNQLTLPAVFRDGMVLQRQKPICAWGTAENGARISVTLGTDIAWAEASDGKWRLYLPPLEAGTDLTLRVSAGEQTIVVQDVAVGEVWLAGGQSNMEFLLRDDAEHAEACQFTDACVRCFEVPKIAYEGQEADRDYSQVGIWREARPGDSEFFTAVGFYFARELRESLNVPIGIINCTWGGTSASAWVPEEDLTGELSFYLNRAAEAREKLDPATEKEAYKDIQRMMDALPPMNAIVNEHPLAATEEMKASMARMDLYNLCAYSPFRPCGLFHTMLMTVVPYSLRGILWYQGESDEYFGGLYEPLTRALIRRWRSLWHEELPFLMVQLASFEYMMEPLDFVPIRAMQQRIAEDTPGVRLVCAMDAGLRYDIHPKHKRPIGRRLALQALRHVYGRPVLSDSPSLRGIRLEDGELVLSFRHGEGLHVKGDAPRFLELIVDGHPEEAFTAVLREECMVLRAPSLARARNAEVRFAWKPFCEDNVYNRADLPVLHFRAVWPPENAG